MTTDQVEAIRESFDARAPEYDRNAMHRALAESVARFASVPDEGTVVDVATGTGLAARELARLHRQVRITGVDISPGMLAVARDALPHAEWIEADATRLPVAAASTDLILCVTALHLFTQPQRVIAEWARVLRPGGRAVTATFISDGHHAPHCEPRAVPYTRDHASFATPERLQTLYAPVGLRIERLATWVRADDRVLIAEAVRG